MALGQPSKRVWDMLARWGQWLACYAGYVSRALPMAAVGGQSFAAPYMCTCPVCLLCRDPTLLTREDLQLHRGLAALQVRRLWKLIILLSRRTVMSV